MYYLSNAIARVCTGQNGLQIVQFPSGVRPEYAEEVVRRANQIAAVSPPFAILVGSDDDLETDLDVPRVSRRNAIRYRRGDRLAVVLGASVDLASFDNSYREVLGAGFPAQVSSGASLAALAPHLVDALVEELGVAVDEVVRTRCATSLALALDVLARCYELAIDSTRAWNALWFEHVEVGLSALSRALVAVRDGSGSRPIGEAFEVLSWASLGLPQPVGRKSWRAERAPKEFMEALAQFWADPESIGFSTMQLKAQVGDPDWTQLGWDQFESARIVRESNLGALQTVVVRDLPSLEAWCEMNRVYFEAPMERDSTLRVTDAEGRAFAVRDARAPSLMRIHGEADSWRTSSFEVHIPAREVMNGCDVAQVGLEASGSILHFVVESRRVETREVVLSGYLTTSSLPRFKPIHTNLSIKVDAKRPESGWVSVGATAQIVAVAAPLGALVWPIGRSLGRPDYVGPANSLELAEDEDRDFRHELSREREHLVVLWGDGLEQCDVDLVPIPASRAQTATIAPGGGLEARFEAATISVRGASGGTGYPTPLTAAVAKGSTDHGVLDEVVTQSVRGLVEECFAHIAGSAVLRTNGHLVVATEGTTTTQMFRADETIGVAAVDDYARKWNEATGMSIPAELTGSAVVREMQAALEAILASRSAEEGERWPSRTSWRHLSGGPELDRYLRAYASVLEASRSMSEMARFWAAYPFSVSMWDEDFRCTGVLISPLHPIRLAWLAGAESTLHFAADAPALAGTVEGWQFPLIGPAPTPSGRMLAVASDSGIGQVFAAWSAMVPASPNDNEPLRPEPRALGRPAPGASPSGLTASAAEAALRDFLRTNPHVPSLTIDLSAAAETSRLVEVDEAVVATIKTWAKDSNRWGVRVMDSVHRTGDLPRRELSKLMSDTSGVPALTWSRYLPGRPGSRERKNPLSNIRLLQDSGAEVRTRQAAPARSQVAGCVPLRRFSTGDLVENGEAFRDGSLNATGWSAFDAALSAIETIPHPAQVGIRLSRSYLTDASADWTVSGEAFLSPAAVAELVASPSAVRAAGGERMLWEWRPPYLQGKFGGEIDRRSYVTVARVSAGLRNNLGRKLTEVTGWEGERLEEGVSEILTRLGTEGLGLSSLLTRGGTHESGALGFYLAYRLLAKAADEAAMDVVLPLDACETFLTALGGRPTPNSAKRADLLLMRFFENELVLTPVEIKFYGSNGAGVRSLPQPGLAFKEAVGQLRETMDSLRRLATRAEQLEGADRRLWFNAFATLVESGLVLTSQRSGRIDHVMLLSEVVAGKTAIRVGSPVVFYFAHDHDAQGDAFETHIDQLLDSTTFGALAARPRGVFHSLGEQQDDNALIPAVRNLIAWAVGRGTPGIEAGSETGSNAEASTPGRETTDLQTGINRVANEASGVDAGALRDAASSSHEPQSTSRPLGVVGDGIRFPVGRYVGALGTAVPEFWPSNTALNQLNIGVVGDLGTGKTQLLQALILNLRSTAARVQPNPVSFLILDYKKDFQKPSFTAAVGGVVLSPRNIPINPFEIKGDYSQLKAYERAKDFCDVIERIYSGVGPVQRQRLTTAVMDSFANHPERAPVLSEVLERYQSEVAADSVTSILRDFVMREVFVEDRGPTVSFEKLLEDRVVILALNELGTDKEAKNALIALFLNEYYAYMLDRPKWPFVGGDPSLRRLNSYLLIDEAVNIMRYDFEVLENLLLQGREFGVGVILSSQFLSHFRTAKKNWAEPLLTWFVHKVPHVTVRDLDRIGLDANQDLADQVGSLANHEAIYKSLGVAGRRIRGNPFFELIARQAASTEEANEGD